MASSLDEAATTKYSTFKITSAFTTSTDLTIAYAAYSTSTVDGHLVTIVYGPPVETLSTIYTVTAETVISLASSSLTTDTNGTPNPATSTSTASEGLSSGAKAGIGVGAAVISLIFAAFIAGCLIVRRRRRRQRPLPEVVSPAHDAGYHKPELDATETAKPTHQESGGGSPEKTELEANFAKQSHIGIQANRVELDGAPKSRIDGRAELDGRMVTNQGKIT